MIVQPLEPPPRSGADHDGIVIRRVSTTDEYAECDAIQRETWGQDFTERVPTTILRVTQYIGGVTAGAFAPAGKLLGFVFGITGIRDARLVHWSDLLAVRAEARDRGVGRRLKLFQRELVRDLGVDTMYWTFDPLVARNAHLNLTRLGARVAEYAPDMYGDQLGSSALQGIGTDRFIVQWDLVQTDGSAATRADHMQFADPHELGRARSVERHTATFPSDSPNPANTALIDAPTVRVEIPNDIAAVVARDATAARKWRDATRRAFLWYLDRGYRVTGFRRHEESGHAYYELTRPSRDS